MTQPTVNKRLKTLRRRADYLAQCLDDGAYSENSASYDRAELDALRYAIGVIEAAHPHLARAVEAFQRPPQAVITLPAQDGKQTLRRPATIGADLLGLDDNGGH